MSQVKKCQFDDVLLDKLKAGDELEVTRWFETYLPKVRKFVAVRVSSPEDVEDLTQSIFINSLKQLPLFRGESSLWSWMCSISRHEVADFYRKKYAKRILNTVPMLDHILGVEDFSLETDSQDRGQIVAKILGKMQSTSSMILRLKYFEELAVTEIAQKLKKTPKSIESQLFRARQEFKAHWHQMVLAESS